MSTVNYQDKIIDNGIILVTWGPLGQGDSGQPYYAVPSHVVSTDRSAHVSGEFGSGGTVVIQGGNDLDASNVAPLTDPQGNNLSFSAAAIKQITEACLQIAPTVTGGDGSTAVYVRLLMCRHGG